VRKREIERQRRKQRRAELRTSETWAKIQKGTREDRWGKSRYVAQTKGKKARQWEKKRDQRSRKIQRGRKER